MEYTPYKRAECLRKMRKASDVFYVAATRANCHAFIEFTGLMNEFIKVCAHADTADGSWMHANVHGDHHLPFEEYHLTYIQEKLECIFGDAIEVRLRMTNEPMAARSRKKEWARSGPYRDLEPQGPDW